MGASGSCEFPLTIPVAFELVLFDGVVRCVVVPVAGSHSKCAGLTRSNETVSRLLPFIKIFMTLLLLTMTLKPREILIFGTFKPFCSDRSTPIMGLIPLWSKIIF